MKIFNCWLACLLIFCLNSFAQEGDFLREDIIPLSVPKDFQAFDTSKWVQSSVPTANIGYKFPVPPSFEEKQIYNSKGIQKIQSASYTDLVFNLNYNVQYRALSSGMKGKEIDAVFNEEIQRLSINFGGYPTIKKRIGGASYEEMYLEISFKPDKILRCRLIYAQGSLINFYIVGTAPAIFSLPTSYFLDNISGLETTPSASSNSTSNPTVSKKKKGKEKPTAKILTWVKFTSKEFNAEYPYKPQEKIYKIEDGNANFYYSKNYFTRLSGRNLSMVGSVSTKDYSYANPETQFVIAIDKIRQETGAVIESEKTFSYIRFNNREYILKSKKDFYRIRLYLTPAGFFQVMVKGSLEEINSPDADYFIQNFKIND
ncbi:MAG: hypothetical protein K1X55_12180 [Chitinophagales bacterium]|nr:hypothetical protein [Chitinophagales bacterium]